MMILSYLIGQKYFPVNYNLHLAPCDLQPVPCVSRLVTCCLSLPPLLFSVSLCYIISMKAICTNKKAFHEYHIEDKFEAGLVLTGTEIKSAREGRA